MRLGSRHRHRIAAVAASLAALMIALPAMAETVLFTWMRASITVGEGSITVLDPHSGITVDLTDRQSFPGTQEQTHTEGHTLTLAHRGDRLADDAVPWWDGAWTYRSCGLLPPDALSPRLHRVSLDTGQATEEYRADAVASSFRVVDAAGHELPFDILVSPSEAFPTAGGRSDIRVRSDAAEVPTPFCVYWGHPDITSAAELDLDAQIPKLWRYFRIHLDAALGTMSTAESTPLVAALELTAESSGRVRIDDLVIPIEPDEALRIPIESIGATTTLVSTVPLRWTAIATDGSPIRSFTTIDEDIPQIENDDAGQSSDAALSFTTALFAPEALAGTEFTAPLTPRATPRNDESPEVLNSDSAVHPNGSPLESPFDESTPEAPPSPSGPAGSVPVPSPPSAPSTTAPTFGPTPSISDPAVTGPSIPTPPTSTPSTSTAPAAAPGLTSSATPTPTPTPTEPTSSLALLPSAPAISEPPSSLPSDYAGRSDPPGSGGTTQQGITGPVSTEPADHFESAGTSIPSEPSRTEPNGDEATSTIVALRSPYGPAHVVITAANGAEDATIHREIQPHDGTVVVELNALIQANTSADVLTIRSANGSPILATLIESLMEEAPLVSVLAPYGQAPLAPADIGQHVAPFADGLDQPAIAADTGPVEGLRFGTGRWLSPVIDLGLSSESEVSGHMGWIAIHTLQHDPRRDPGGDRDLSGDIAGQDFSPIMVRVASGSTEAEAWSSAAVGPDGTEATAYGPHRSHRITDIDSADETEAELDDALSGPYRDYLRLSLIDVVPNAHDHHRFVRIEIDLHSDDPIHTPVITGLNIRAQMHALASTQPATSTVSLLDDPAGPLITRVSTSYPAPSRFGLESISAVALPQRVEVLAATPHAASGPMASGDRLLIIEPSPPTMAEQAETGIRLQWEHPGQEGAAPLIISRDIRLRTAEQTPSTEP